MNPAKDASAWTAGSSAAQWKKTSPVAMDSVFITTSIEATKNRNVVVVTLPGAYLSAAIDDKEEVIMVLHGPLTEIMALTAPQVERKIVTVDNNGRQILCVKLQKASYGMLNSALLSTANSGVTYMQKVHY